MILLIAVSSKNKNSLKAFTIFMKNILISHKSYFSDYNVYQIHSNKKLKYYSVLTSPHVFKKAQRQIGFKSRALLWEFRVNTRFVNQIVIIMKRILQINLKDLNVKLKFFINTIENKNQFIRTFDPDYYYVSILLSNKNNYIGLLDVYGSSLFCTHELLYYKYQV